MLKFKIKEILEASGIQYPAPWLIKFCDFSEGKAYKLLNNKQTSISLNDLSKLCENLNCTPNDFVYWADNGRNRLPENHPVVTNLTSPDKTSNWFKLFKLLPPDKIVELQKSIITNLNQ